MRNKFIYRIFNCVILIVLWRLKYTTLNTEDGFCNSDLSNVDQIFMIVRIFVTMLKYEYM